MACTSETLAAGLSFTAQRSIKRPLFWFKWETFQPSSLAILPTPKIPAIAAGEEQNSVQKALPPLSPCHWHTFTRASAVRRRPTLLDVRRSCRHLASKCVVLFLLTFVSCDFIVRCRGAVSGSAQGDLSHLWLPVVCNQVVPDPQLPLANQRGRAPREHKRLS